MAIADDAKWDASQWNLDRFQMVATSTAEPSPTQSKSMNTMFGDKNSNICQVDNCTIDVTSMKEYHLRYKICEQHLKASTVIKDGRSQRFCQQCGKFQDIGAFDGEKRSCRERLSRHNARRRRMREMQHMLRTTGRIDEAALQAKYGAWDKDDEPGSAKMKKATGKRGSSAWMSTKSHSQTQSQSGMTQPMTPSMGMPNLSLDLLDDDFLNDILGPGGSLNNSIAQLSTSGSNQSANTFLDMDPSTVMDLDDIAVLEELTTELGHIPAADFARTQVLAPHHQAQQAAAFPFAAPAFGFPGMPPQTIGGLPPYLQAPPQQMPQAMDAVTVEQVNHGPGHAVAPDVTSALDQALQLLAYDQGQVAYVAEEKLMRVSAKLFGCTPADLPSNLKTSLMEMLSAQGGMEGYMRPGCVHLTVDAALGADAHQNLSTEGIKAAVERLLRTPNGPLSAAHTALVQLGDRIAVVRDGKVVHVLSCAASARLFPTVAAVRPLAFMSPQADDHDDADDEDAAPASVTVSIWGYNLGVEGDEVLIRSQGKFLETKVLRNETNPAWEAGLTRLDVEVFSPPAQGALSVEIMRGAFTSGRKTTVACSSLALVAEICSLETMQDAGDVDTMLFEVGAILEGLGKEAVASSTTAAARMLPFAVQRKWPALTKASLDAAVRCPSSEAVEVVATADIIAAGTTGMSLLQLAVRTQSLEMVNVLLDWGKTHGHTFSSTTPGRSGLTALHLAALVRDSGAIAKALTVACPDALDGWDTAVAQDGSSPLGLASRYGTAGALERLIAEFRFEATAASNKSAAQAMLAEAAAECGCEMPSCSRRPKEGLEIDPLPSKAEMLIPADDQMNGVTMNGKAHMGKGRSLASGDGAMGRFLQFASPVLEERYASWYNRGQIPVDLAFMVIAVLSQGAWVFRWSMHQSILGWVMLALMAYNCIVMQVAIMRPALYAQHREALCMLSHLVHKIAQMLVTVMPVVGTLYSPTYNISVALLESSSFAQIAMLAFGAKGRAVYHVPTLVLLMMMSMTMNSQICSVAFPYVSMMACSSGMALFQTTACCAAPALLVYGTEYRSRRIFLQSQVS